MSYIPRGRSVGQKGGCSEGPGHSGPIQTDPESSVRCRRGISARDRNKPHDLCSYSFPRCTHITCNFLFVHITNMSTGSLYNTVTHDLPLVYLYKVSIEEREQAALYPKRSYTQRFILLEREEQRLHSS